MEAYKIDGEWSEFYLKRDKEKINPVLRVRRSGTNEFVLSQQFVSLIAWDRRAVRRVYPIQFVCVLEVRRSGNCSSCPHIPVLVSWHSAILRFIQGKWMKNFILRLLYINSRIITICLYVARSRHRGINDWICSTKISCLVSKSELRVFKVERSNCPSSRDKDSTSNGTSWNFF